MGARNMERAATRLAVESLEERIAPAWAGIPPASITPPASALYFRLSEAGVASGNAAISSGENDFYTFIAPVSQQYTIQATTPSSNVDTVLGVFSSTGALLAYNDDISATNFDSRLTIDLVAGQRYYIGITKYTGTINGSYSWQVQGARGDDLFEQNDSRAAAWNLGTLTGPLTIPNLVLADSNDWFRFTLGAAGTSADYARISFTNSLGNLQLELYNSAGTRIRSSLTTANTEQITLNGLAAGTYYLRVFGASGAFNPQYQLDLRVPQQGPADDAYEQNDSFSQAYNLGTLASTHTYNGLVMADAADWFRFTTTGTAAAAAQVSIQFQHAQGDLDLALYNSSGTLISRSEGTSNSESLSLAGLSAGTFYIQVYGYQGVFNPAYTLFVNATTEAAPPPPASAFQIDLTFSSGMTAAQIAVFQEAAARWSQIIVGDLPNVTYNGQVIDDIRIDARVVAIDGVGGILGQAGPTNVRSNYLPYLGIMEFDSADVAAMMANGSFLNVIMHEMGHVLGIGTIWSYRGLLSGAGTSNPLFIGAQATAQYNAIFGTNASGVPVENTGGSGTRDGHWRESVFSNELMTGWINSGSNPLSRITIASLADLGYTVNLNAADFYAPPGSAVQTPTGGSGGSGASIRTGGGCGCGACQLFAPAAKYADLGETAARPGLPFALSTLVRKEIDPIVRLGSWRLAAPPVESAPAGLARETAPAIAALVKDVQQQADTSLAADWFASLFDRN